MSEGPNAREVTDACCDGDCIIDGAGQGGWAQVLILPALPS